MKTAQLLEFYFHALKRWQMIVAAGKEDSDIGNECWNALVTTWDNLMELK